jgi:anti-sigma factor ChrR (cupin superfamily)
MAHTHDKDEMRSTAALYAVGALSAEEARAFAEHMTVCEECREEAQSFASAAGLLAESLPDAPPPPAVRDRLLGRVAKPAAGSGLHVVRSGEGEWKATPFPGVTYKTLYYDRETTMVTNLLRMERGCYYPAHRHTAMEQCLVLEGDVRQDDVIMTAGDYSRFDADRIHSRISTENGCLLLLISSARDELAE